MNRRLFYLNALLLIGIAGFGTRLRMLWLDARQAEEMVRLNQLKGPVFKGAQPTPQVQAVNAMNYSDVAMRMLFSKDRNPTVIVEVKVEPPKPEEIVPPLPKSYGVMLIGSPKILMSAKGGDGQKIYKVGDKVGEFEILKFDSRMITLKFHDKEITKELSELVDNTSTPAPAAVAGPPTASGAGADTKARVVSTNDTPAKPGDDVFGNQTRACAAGDSSPNGTVQDGMKKVMVANPFGVSCHWEPTK